MTPSPSTTSTADQMHTDQVEADDRSGPEHTPRLRLKPKAAATGYVDGAWWPHSDDLAAELPDLLAVLSVRLGPVGRVMYRMDDWATPPARLVTGGRSVRLDGYRRQPFGTVEVAGLAGRGIVLAVVAPQTKSDQAHATLMAAAHPGDTSSVAELLATDGS